VIALDPRLERHTLAVGVRFELPAPESHDVPTLRRLARDAGAQGEGVAMLDPGGERGGGSEGACEGGGDRSVGERDVCGVWEERF
jgi:hypothetical protein